MGGELNQEMTESPCVSQTLGAEFTNSKGSTIKPHACKDDIHQRKHTEQTNPNAHWVCFTKVLNLKLLMIYQIK